MNILIYCKKLKEIFINKKWESCDIKILEYE